VVQGRSQHGGVQVTVPFEIEIEIEIGLTAVNRWRGWLAARAGLSCEVAGPRSEAQSGEISTLLEYRPPT
jgi:hypothetical protein